MSWEATLHTNWRCAGGVPIADLGIIADDSVLDDQLDGRSQLTIGLDGAYYDLCRRRNAVVFLTSDDGRWREFRIDGLTRAAKSTQFELTALPPWYDLSAADLVRETVNGRVVTSFVETRTFYDLLVSRVLANAAVDGLTFFAPGTIEFDDLLALTWSRLKPSALILHARDVLKRGEINVRADGFDGYLIDLVAAVGADQPVLPLRFGDRLLDMQSATDFGPLYSAIRVVGDVPTADAEPASFADNVYRAHSVTAIGPGGIGPYAVVLRDPATDVSPIQLDGLFAHDPNEIVPSCWLQLASGNTTEILESRAATGDVVVAIPPAVNDRVVIVQTSDNLPLERIMWPAAVAEHGVVVADARVPGGRGERNLIVNPGLDGNASDYTVMVGAYMTLLPRSQVVPLVGAMNGTKASGAPASFAVDGFVLTDVAKRGDICEVEGVQFTTVGDAFLDENGEGTVNISTTLPATIPANTQLRSSAAAYVLSRGSSNTIGDADIDITVPGVGTSPWATNDELTFTVPVPETQTLTGALDRTYQFVRLQLAVAFTRDIPTGAWVTWTHESISRLVQVADPYVTGAPELIVRHPTWTIQAQLRGEVQPFGLAGETIRHVLIVSSRHTVTNSPTWGTNAQATVIISPALPFDAPAALTEVRWDRVGAAAFVGNLQLVADQSATATTFAVLGTGLVVVIPNGTILTLLGESFTLTADTTLTGGAGTLSTFYAPTTTLLDNAVVRLYRNTDWAAEQGGGENVAMVESGLAIDDAAPGLTDATMRSLPFRVVLPPGATAQLFARVAMTFYSPARTNASQQYGAAKVALVNLDTNAIVAWAGSQPEDAASLSAPANGRLPLTWDPATRTWLPLHFALSCNVVVTATTRFELRVYGPYGVVSASYARTYLRWASAWVAGATDRIPFVNGSRANDLILTGVQLLQRDARPADTYTIEMADFDLAHFAAADLPPAAAPVVDVGGRVLLEEDNAELRIHGIQRRPSRPLSQVVVGTRPPNAAYTLATVAVVSSGGSR